MLALCDALQFHWLKPYLKNKFKSFSEGSMYHSQAQRTFVMYYVDLEDEAKLTDILGKLGYQDYFKEPQVRRALATKKMSENDEGSEATVTTAPGELRLIMRDRVEGSTQGLLNQKKMEVQGAFGEDCPQQHDQQKKAAWVKCIRAQAFETLENAAQKATEKLRRAVRWLKRTHPVTVVAPSEAEPEVAPTQASTPTEVQIKFPLFGRGSQGHPCVKGVYQRALQPFTRHAGWKERKKYDDEKDNKKPGGKGRGAKPAANA
ncbi:hypothetical protein CYMTET_42382 [Cymbomonas tetramitiformis]|uniref:Uncharacterized protein n=1 Tax=Cymbomonas tetramitiformis TaxID=36881 RepID=A0AAE0F1K3_9CHLO|nr:hypothetical protein CYMTET_42382 [Cymbomonas tetramitiformis]